MTRVLDGRFELERIAGQGGGGVIHRGRDRATGEPVAIKVSRAAGDDPRFVREVDALATLRHPAIVRYLHHGADDGERYLVMEWLDGEDLGARLAAGRLSLADALTVARQIASALAAAHEKGVVHRDVKPSNVFLVGGQLDRAKLLDFGLARPAGLAALTTSGMVVGTPSYMAPEQARGARELDARVDVYGLGALLFHCASGRAPFVAETVDEVLARILADPVPRLGTLVDGVSPALDTLVTRMLSKDPARRPADGRAAHAAILGLDHPAPADDDESWTSPAADTQLLQVRTQTLASRADATPATSIAVLPLVDMSPERDQGYLCAGIADELIDALGKVDGLRVAARISTNRVDASPREIGARLGVDAILEGGLRLAGNRLRVTVQLVDVATGYQRWSHRFAGSLDDVFAMEDEIAARVVVALRGMLTGRDEAAMRRPGANVEAYSLFLRARQLIHSMSPSAYRTAVDLFERAIAIDPTYAPAYAGLAEIHCRYFEWSYGDDDTRAAADRASLRALELAPQLADAHVARGQVLKVFRRYAEARQAFDEAIRLDPNGFEPHHLYGRLAFEAGDLDTSVAMFRRAGEIRLEDYQCPLLLAQTLRRLGRDDEARTARSEGLRRVERQLAIWPSDARALALGATELVQNGDADRALEWAARATAAAPDDPGIWYNVACTYASLRRVDDALAWLAKTFELGMAARDWVDRDPDFDHIRDDPRFRALADKLV